MVSWKRVLNNLKPVRLVLRVLQREWSFCLVLLEGGAGREPSFPAC